MSPDVNCMYNSYQLPKLVISNFTYEKDFHFYPALWNNNDDFCSSFCGCSNK